MDDENFERTNFNLGRSGLRGYLPILAVLTMGVAISVGAFVFVQRSEVAKAQYDFDTRAIEFDRRAADSADRFQRALGEVQALQFCQP